MSVLAQGTQIYFIDPGDGDSTGSAGPIVVNVECATSFTPGGNPADQLEDTCLEDSDRAYRPGLRTPGKATIGINPDPDNASHIRMHELSQTTDTLKWAVGWSDGTEAPTLDSTGDFDLPATRTWFTFEGYIDDFPFDFARNTIVTSTVSIQRSGGSAWVAKT